MRFLLEAMACTLFLLIGYRAGRHGMKIELRNFIRVQHINVAKQTTDETDILWSLEELCRNN